MSLNFPGICEQCPLALLCATDIAYEEKNLCHCTDCRQVLMVFREIGRESISKMMAQSARQPSGSTGRHIFNLFYNQGGGEILIGLVGDFPCPHPYTGQDFTCPACEKERGRKETEALGRISYVVKK